MQCRMRPPAYTSLQGPGLREVHRDYARFLRQDVYRMEYSAERARELWHSNGFLGGWVAAKALVGQFDDAWARMLVSYDRNSDWSLEECTTGAPLDKCPVGFKKRSSFPEALRKHLIANGYIGGRKHQFRDSTLSLRTPPSQHRPLHLSRKVANRRLRDGSQQAGRDT
jgi:hypothetical protein